MATNKHSMALMNYKAQLYGRIEARNPQLAAQVRELKLDWFRMTNQAETEDTPETTEILIYDEIGTSFGVDAQTFIEELNALETPNINIRINSPGGSLFDSIAIHNAILSKRQSATVNTYVDALAASGASIIAMSGEDVIMMP